MAAPDYTLPGNDPGHVLLIRRNGSDNLVAVRFDLRHRNRDYWVRSAYVLSEGKLERIFDAIRRQGGTPELLAVARLPEAPGQAQPPSPHSDGPAVRLIKIARGEIASNPPSGGDAKYSLFVLKKLRSQAPVDASQTAGTPATMANTATADDGLQKFLWLYSGGQITDPKQLEEDQSEVRRNAMVMGLLQIAANAGQAKTIGGVLSGVASGAAGGMGEYQNQKKARRDEQQQEFGNRVGLGKLFFDAEGARASREAAIEDRWARLQYQQAQIKSTDDYRQGQLQNQTDKQAADIIAYRTARLQKIEDAKREAYKLHYDTIAKGLIENNKNPYLDPKQKTLSPTEIAMEADRQATAMISGGAGAATGGGQQTIRNPKDGKLYIWDEKAKKYKLEPGG